MLLPLLLSFTYCTFVYIYIFFCTLVKSFIKLIKLKMQTSTELNLETSLLNSAVT